MNICLKENRTPRGVLSGAGVSGVIKRFFSIVKPGIIFGNLVTAAGGFFLASRGRIDVTLLFSTLAGISLVVASGCVFNNWIDRGMDRKMARTRGRVLARGLMTTRTALCYASLLGIAGTALLSAAANMLAVVIVLIGFFVYVGIYSLWLKQSSIHAVPIGSLAGAAPPLAAYCAVSGRFGMEALILFSIFSLWQIPHSYAIALYRLDDYTAAAIPVLPVKRTLSAVKKHIAFYILAFLTAAMMLTAAGYAGYGYLATAVVAGSVWMIMALAGGTVSDARIWAKRLFLFSILTIAALSVMMSIDFTVPVNPVPYLIGRP